MSDPAKHVPADGPLGRGDGGFDLGALGLGVARAVGVGAVVQLTDQLPGALKRMQATMAVIADMHPPPTDRTVAVKDVKFEESDTNVDRVLPPLRKPHSVGVLADAFFSCSTDHPPIIEAIVR